MTEPTIEGALGGGAVFNIGIGKLCATLGVFLVGAGAVLWAVIGAIISPQLEDMKRNLADIRTDIGDKVRGSVATSFQDVGLNRETSGNLARIQADIRLLMADVQRRK